ncbi:MAG: twin-arginine translocase subunit TatC [Planctomycetota bacterium]|nr:twin-arginine translocase subunit TatC [Planctomycetota bacterium]
MSFGDHLEELRQRLVHALLGIAPIFIAAMFLGRWILELIIAPVQDQLRASGLSAALQATSPLEAFNTYFRIALIVTVIVGVPWILWQVWRFVAPGLYESERRFIRFLLPLSVVLSVTGVVFLFKVILPLTLAFLINFSASIGSDTRATAPLPEGVTLGNIPVLIADPPAPKVGDEWFNATYKQRCICVGVSETGVPEVWVAPFAKKADIVPQYKISEYVDTVLVLALSFAAGFQLPVVVLLLGWVGVIDQAFLRKYRRHAMLGCAVVAAFLTPGDPLSMFLLALPLIVLYELGGLLLRWFPAHRVAGKPKPTHEDADADIA